MNIKLYLLLFLPFLAFSESRDPERNARDGKPFMWRIPVPEEHPVTDRWDGMFYRFDGLTQVWNNQSWFSPLKLDEQTHYLAVNDPVKFFIASNKDSVGIGEEVELTITAHYLDVHPMLMFQFEGANEFTLKLLMPEGFVMTGGTYYDFVQGKVDRNNPTQKFTVKGFFEGGEDWCFNLLRGAKGSGIESVFYKVSKYCLILSHLQYKSNSLVTSEHHYSEPDSLLISSDNDRKFRLLNNDCGTVVNLNFAGNSIGWGNWPTGWNNTNSIDTWACGQSLPSFYGPTPNSNCDGLIVGFWVGNWNEGIDRDFYFEANKVYTITLDQGISGLRRNHTAFFRVTIGGINIDFPNFQSGNQGFNTVSRTVAFTTSGMRNVNIQAFTNEFLNGSTRGDQAYLFLNNFNISTFTERPAAPVIASSNGNIAPATLTATCSSGTVFWSTGSRADSIRPNTPGTYVAVCQLSGNCFSDPTPHELFSCPTIAVPTFSDPTIPSGQNSVDITANCGNNTVVWIHPAGHTGNTVQGTHGNTYRAMCRNAAGCESSEDSVTAQNCTPPARPSITPAVPVILSGQSSVTLNANCVPGTTPDWEHGSSSSSVEGLNGTSYRVRCVLNGCYSDWSAPALVQNCTPPPYPVFYAGSLKIDEGATTPLTVSYCGGTASFYRDGTATPFYTSVDYQSINVGAGTYYATCTVNDCISQPTPAIPIKTVGCDYDINIGSNAFNTGLSVGDQLQLWSSISGGEAGATYSYSWEKNQVETGANTDWHVIHYVQEADKGNYRLRVRQNGYNKFCYSEPVYINVSPCNFSGTLSYQQLANSDLWIKVNSSKACNGCSYRFYRNGTYVAEGGNDYLILPNTAANRGNYHVQVTTTVGCTFNTNTINVNFPAQPNYSARVDNMHCDYVSGILADYANPNVYQRGRLVLTNSTTNAEVFTQVIEPTSNHAGEWYYRVNFPEAYKNGSTYKVVVQHINNNYANGSSKILTCCNLNVVSTQVPEVCDVESKTAVPVFRFANRNTGLALNYKIARKTYLEGGSVQYQDITAYIGVPASIANNQDVAMQALPTGEYRLELRQGDLNQATNCIVYDYFTVDCNSLIGGCRAPEITVSPSDEVQEGLNITPILFANFLKTDGVASSGSAGFSSVGVFTGNSALGLGDMGGFDNITAEAWVNIDAASTISVGEMGEGTRQRYLFSSLTDGVQVSWKLSVGSNGFTLMEFKPNSAEKRVAMAHQMNLQGWHYISLVYRNNLPSVYIDGAEVLTAQRTPKDAFRMSTGFQVRGVRTVGGQHNEGFRGLIDEVKAYSNARTANEIKSNMQLRDVNVAAMGSNLSGYFTFEGSNAFVNKKHPGQNTTEVRGDLSPRTIVGDNALSTIYKTADLDWYYKGTLVAENAIKYTMPEEHIRVGEYTYTVKWSGKNGETCETSKTVTITPAELSQLSGCFTVTPQQYSNTLMVMANYPSNSVRGIRTQTPGNISGENSVWQFDYLGNETYKIRLAANDKYISEKTFWISGTDNGEVQLLDGDNASEAQRWKVRMLNGSATSPVIRVSNYAGNRILAAGSEVNRNVTLDQTEQGDTYARQNFKLTKTGCPTPPKPCVSDRKVTVERLNVSNTNAIDYMHANRDKMEMFVNQYRNENQTVTYTLPSNRWDFNGYPVKGSNGQPDVSQSSQFVARMSGYICPSQSQNFNFRLEGPRSRMYLSNNEDPRGKQLVINNDDGSGTTSWNIALTQGRSYYYEVITMDSYSGGNGNGNFHDYQKLYVNDMSNPVQMNMFSSAPRDTKPKKDRTDDEACGIMPPSPSASDDMPMLFAGDTLYAADFKVIIQSVAGANGTFSGNGFANMKYLMDTPIKVRFDGIRVNDYYELVGGEITTEYDKNWGNVIDADSTIRSFVAEVKDLGEAIKDLLAFDPENTSKEATDAFMQELIAKANEELDAAMAAQYQQVHDCLEPEMAIIEANKNACKNIPPDQAACTAITNAANRVKTICKPMMQALENARQQKLTVLEEIIKMALDKLKSENASLIGSKRSQYEGTIPTGYSTSSLSEADEKLFNSSKIVGTASFEDLRLSQSEQATFRNVFTKEVDYNYRVLLFNFGSKRNSESKAVGEELVLRSGRKLSKYILDELAVLGTSTPSQAQKQTLAFGRTDGGSVQSVITEYLNEIFQSNVYGRTPNEN